MKLHQSPKADSKITIDHKLVFIVFIVCVILSFVKNGSIIAKFAGLTP